MANLATKCTKASWPMIATLVRSIFDQPDRDSTWAKLAEVTSRLTRRVLRPSDYLLDAADDILAFAAFPFEHWKRSVQQPQERLNKEIRRRTDVVGIFPNRQAVIRLVGALLGEQNDEWAVSRRYVTIESLSQPAIIELSLEDPRQRSKPHSSRRLPSISPRHRVHDEEIGAENVDAHELLHTCWTNLCEFEGWFSAD